MFYVQIDDIDPNLNIDSIELDELLRNAVNRCSIELRSVNNLSSEARNLLADLLLAFRITHRSIRLLVGQYEKEMEISSDALSLAREQIEKIFVSALIIDDPVKWVQAYMKDGWKKKYEEFLLDREENQNLPDRVEFLTNIGPRLIEEGRVINGITNDEMAAIEFKFLNPGKELPQNLKGKLIDDFPTPGIAKDKIKDAALKNDLKRWHLEYRLICGYNHVGMEKLVGQALTNRRHGITESQRTDYFEKKLLHSLIISWIAAASACTEIYRFVSYNLEITGELTKLWNVLEQGSLLGKVFWNLRAKTILPTLF
jgi:hypothetical protein